MYSSRLVSSSLVYSSTLRVLGLANLDYFHAVICQFIPRDSMIRPTPPPYLARNLVAKPSSHGHFLHLVPRPSCPSSRPTGFSQRQHKVFFSDRAAPTISSTKIYRFEPLPPCRQQNPSSQTADSGTTSPSPTNDNAQNRHNRPRAAPSTESGGIPSPSELYLTQALPPPTTLPSPRRILVILDLNGTLLYRPSRRHPSRFVQRPHAQDFLHYCLETFHLAIWSSARRSNVSNMVSQLLTPAQRSQCVVMWARDKLGLCPKDYDARVQVYKRLSLIWNDARVMASHPDASEGGRWDQSNTVLVDDSLEKGRSEPYNILPIPEFVGLQAEPPNVLPQVHDYLNQLCFQVDVSRFMRETPFHLNPAYTLAENT
ncbi:hypothetical protein E4U21_007754 [Claviceps maximensis]|nr:hypothetical protein E4U21_007754 [Claviceps maximensis]